MLINLTPHAVVLLLEDDRGQIKGTLGYGQDAIWRNFRLVATLPSAGVARVTTAMTVIGKIKVNGDDVPVTKIVYAHPENLPEPDGKTTFIVSFITAQAAKLTGRNTDDLLVVGETVRDADGRILGCIALGRV